MGNIKLSILDLSPIYQNVTPQEALHQTVLLAQTAERLGYTRFWVPEHHDMMYLASSSPEIMLAHLGAKTNKIRIGSGAVLLPYYKPYKVAEVFHLLATLYPGRVDLGIGRAPGGSAHASLALSDSYLAKVQQMPDLLKDLSALLSHEYTVEGEPVLARPIPTIPPELWLLGTNLKSAQYAAQYGTGYAFGQFMSEQDGEAIISAYRLNYQASSLHPEPNVIAAVGVICGETEEEAQQLVEASYQWSAVPKAYREENDAPGKKLIVGNSEQVKQELLLLQEKLRVNEFMIVTNIPDYGKRIRSYELLAQAMWNS